MAYGEEYTYKDIRRSISFRSASRPNPFDDSERQVAQHFTLNDYKWCDKYNISNKTELHNNDSVPKLILYERQPVKKPDWSKILSSVQAIDSIPGVSELLQTALSPIQSGVQIGGSTYLKSLENEYSSDKGTADKLLDIADLEGLIEGPIVATYEIPFFSNVYLRSNNRDGWSIGSAIENAGQLTEIINDGFQLNILKTPQWQNSNTEGMDWEVELYLLNDTLDNLKKNFQFIHALYPSSQWVRMHGESIANALKEVDTTLSDQFSTYKTLIPNALEKAGKKIDTNLAFIKSPNVFRVECPGRFLQLFVAIDIAVEYVGNLNQMPLHEKIQDVKQIQVGNLYPDAYKVVLSARDLTPNCYNVYAHYLMKREQVTVTDQQTLSYS